MRRAFALAVPVLLFTACGGDGRTFELSVSSGVPATLASGSKFTLTIYGFDSRIADPTATLIRTQHASVKALPFSLDVGFPEEAEQLIEPAGSVPTEFARFYVVDVFVDVDGDNRICDGDLAQDFNMLAPLRFDAAGPTGPVAMPLTTFAEGTCQVFPVER